MKVIVTGGAGFLGSRVIRQLLAAQDRGSLPVAFDEVVSLDLAPCPVEDPRVVSRVGDIADPELLREVVGDVTVGVYHLAAVLSGGSEVDFDLSMQVNVDGTRTLLEACRVRAVPGQHVELLEAAWVEQHVDALAGEQLALLVLSLDGAR